MFQKVNVANLQESMKVLSQKYLNLLFKRHQTYLSRWKHELLSKNSKIYTFKLEYKIRWYICDIDR